jgi:hypothetical protein
VSLCWPRSEALAAADEVAIGDAAGADPRTVNRREQDEVHGGLEHGSVS